LCARAVFPLPVLYFRISTRRRVCDNGAVPTSVSICANAFGLANRRS
jgi:hypothetical protein